jgi:hypothetical protein
MKADGIECSVSRICICMKCLKVKLHKMPGCIVLTLVQNPIFLGLLIMSTLVLWTFVYNTSVLVPI